MIKNAIPRTVSAHSFLPLNLLNIDSRQVASGSVIKRSQVKSDDVYILGMHQWSAGGVIYSMIL